MKKYLFYLVFPCFIGIQICFGQISPAANQIAEYLPLLKNKKVALVVNQTSVVGNQVHLLDTLMRLKVNVVKVFGPEHGFRGLADAGEKVNNSVDEKTGLPIISLYGANKKPTESQLADVDVVIFDIQDVGVRFYTYISTLVYVMEACAKYNKPLIVLDRPNPNGMYVDGPVLDTTYKSFVGVLPIPIVYGLTMGELAKMTNGEGWISPKLKDLKVFLCKNYTHQSKYSLKIKPSPNLPNDLSIYLYPSLCLFEGTNVSVARGTYYPFQAIGYPDSSIGKFFFEPQSIPSMAKSPMHLGKKCYGIDLRNKPFEPQFTLKYLIDFYQKMNPKEAFFNNFFNKLAGNATLKQQIIDGKSEKEIKNSWKADLAVFEIERKKYLLYK